MNNLKRTLGILLASVLLLTGCTKKPAAPAVTPVSSPVSTQEPAATVQPDTKPSEAPKLSEDTECDDKACVAEYISIYWHLPNNYMTKSQARKHGWKSGRLSRILEGKAIGGGPFQNLEGELPEQYSYKECDIDTINSTDKTRGRKRIVYSVEGKLIYYTDDHYDSFELLYGEE